VAVFQRLFFSIFVILVGSSSCYLGLGLLRSADLQVSVKVASSTLFSS